MKWEGSILDIMLEVLNTFVIKGTYRYFGCKDKVYVINKYLIVDVFGVCGVIGVCIRPNRASQ
jgi:hypothetical protein